MTHSAVEASHQRSAARVAGFMFLLSLAIAVYFEFFVLSRLVVPGDPGATANNILASERLFRIGIAGNLVAFAAVVPLAVALYVLLRPVNRSLALLALAWRVAEAAIYGGATLNLFMLLLLIGGPDYGTALGTDQSHALARLFLQAYSKGYAIGLVFFGLGSAVFTYLLLRSKYIPRALAGLGIVGSLAVIAGNCVIIVLPDSAATIQPGFYAPIFLFELLAGLWLLLKGVTLGRVAAEAEDQVVA